MATSLSCRVSEISAFCWPTTQTPSITNRLVAIIHTKPVIALLVPKLVAMATSLRPSISAMSSLDSLTPKTHPLELNSESLAAIQPKLYRFKVYVAQPTPPRGQPISEMGGGTPSMFGMDILMAQIDAIVLGFPIFPALGNDGAQSVDLGSKNRQKMFFAPQIC